jgi:hypothetical protein
MHSTEGASFDSPGCNPGFTSQHAIVALKGRDSSRRRNAQNLDPSASGNVALSGLWFIHGSLTQGYAALHPGLSNMTPSGSKSSAETREKKQDDLWTSWQGHLRLFAVFFTFHREL